MNKTELIEKIASSAEVSKTVATRVFNAAIEAITNTVSTGEDITIVGFGTFKVVQRAARTGRNPQTGQVIKIAAQKTPRFTAGKHFKEACNSRGKK